MNKRHYFIAAAPLLLMTAGLDAQPAAPATAPVGASRFFPSDAQVLGLLAPHIESGRAKGIVVGLIEPDGSRRILHAGYAGEGAEALSARSMFEIGSLTKSFTGVIFADMVRRGEVALDDPVAKYLPAGVKVPMKDGKPITLRQLSTHTSGLPRLPSGYTPPDPRNPYAAFREADLYASLAAHELRRLPGAEYEYSNLGAGLLGHALARAAGFPNFPALLRSRILRPLGLSATTHGRPPRLSRRMTRGHDGQGRPVPYWDVDVLAGAGGLYSSIGDMLTFLAANLRPPRTPLEQAMRAAHAVHHDSARGPDQGLGWALRVRNGRTLIGNAGATAGYRSFAAFDPERRAGVVILSNSGSFEDVSDLGFELLDPDPRAAILLPAAVLAEYPGTYTLRPGLELAVTAEGGRLFAQATGQGRIQLLSEAKDRFLLRSDEAQLVFERDPAGKVVGVAFHQRGRTLAGPRKPG